MKYLQNVLKFLKYFEYFGKLKNVRKKKEKKTANVDVKQWVVGKITMVSPHLCYPHPNKCTSDSKMLFNFCRHENNQNNYRTI